MDAAPRLTPRMAALLTNIQRARRPAFRTLTPPGARAAYRAGANILNLPRAPLARVDDLVIGASGAARAARLYAASDRSGGVLPALLYFHGGGFTIGDLDTHDSLCRQLALRSGVAVVALDYRLAPEHRFPCAVDDAWAAMQWLALNGHRLGLDGGRLAVGGDSAGGTLATVCALHARDIGLPLRLQVLITPGTAARADSPSHRRFAQGHLLDADGIAWFFDQYIDARDRGDWRFAPLEVEEVDGVAPACVLLAECDPLVDEGLAYADRLRAADVPVALELVRGVTHDFIQLGRVLPEAPAAQAWIADRLRQALADAGPLPSSQPQRTGS